MTIARAQATQVHQVVSWNDTHSRVELLDQTRLPDEWAVLECEQVKEVWQAIRNLSVRGAPAIGIAAAYGVCLAFKPSEDLSRQAAVDKTLAAIEHLATSRPTAVNLFWALDRMRQVCRHAADALSLHSKLVAEAKAIHEQDRQLCDAIGRYGAERLRDAKRFLTHCNAGSLATGGIGTALAPIYELYRRGAELTVFADETRPLLQGSRLTAWELVQAGIPVSVITDSMAGSVLRDKQIDAVIVGADRITRRGDVANKIGTYPLAILAKHHHVPFFVAAPRTTFDLGLLYGDEIPIEERLGAEILEIAGWKLGSDASQEQPGPFITRGKNAVSGGENALHTGVLPQAFNPAFDVTPAELITAIITDVGVIESPTEEKVLGTLHGF